MTVHPFPARATDPGSSVDEATDDIDDEFPYDYHEDFAGFDDVDESMRRFGSFDVQFRHAHRTVSATMLATITGIQIPVCQAFHFAFFGLLEDIGDFDGLIATPDLLIVGRHERIAAASDWLAEHPHPDVPALIAAAEPDESAGDLDSRIIELVERQSLGLASAAGSNPSLTLGSTTALNDRVIDGVLDFLLSCQVDEIDLLTSMSLDLLRRMPTSIRPIGGAVLHPLSDPASVPPLLPPLSV